MDSHTNPLIRMADEATRPSRWWVAWPVAVAITGIGLAVGLLVGQAVLGHPKETESRAQFAELFAFGLIALLLILWVRLKEGRGFSSLGFRGRRPVGRFLAGLLLGAVMMSIGVLVPTALGDLATGRSTHDATGTSALGLLVVLLVVFIIQGSTEEIVFRGYMLPVGARQMPVWVAVLATSVIFAALHPGAGIIGTTNIVLYAVFACLLALQQGSLWMICGFHAGWNFFQGNVFGVPVSGSPEPTSFFTFGPTQGSRELISGGDFGIEASLVGTALLILLLAGTTLATRRSSGGGAHASAPADASAP